MFDLHAVPFSRYGSFMGLNFTFNHAENEPLLLRNVRGVGKSREVMDMYLTKDGNPVAWADVQKIAKPWLLRFEAEGGFMEFCFAEPNMIRLRSEGLGLQMISHGENYPYGIAGPAGRFHIKSPQNRMNLMVGALSGSMDVSHSWDPRPHGRGRRFYCPKIEVRFEPNEDGKLEASIEEFRASYSEADLSETFDEAVAAVKKEWKDWLKKQPKVEKQYGDSLALAAYVNWSAVVGQEDQFTRDTMLMSKNVMTQCWSWDHCFNAMATAYKMPELGWDQLMTLFDHQTPEGVLPDSVASPTCTLEYCKPPIHGWTLMRLMKHKPLADKKHLKEIYGPLVKWTNWWFKHRDYDGDGIPQYNHGNDSGWDNATVFDVGFAVEAPDLSAFLILQMDVLSDIAAKLGKDSASKKWKKRADQLLDRLIEHSWNGEQFVSLRNGDHARAEEGDSMLNFIPIVLGKRLPKKYRKKLAEALLPDGRFVTQYGPATESPQSSLYEKNGYWRGPIWPPSTMLVYDGLLRGGYKDQAKEIARRYCDMCVSSGYMSENYDPLTGEALCDRAYTWGSSVFIILAHELATKLK
ncbi:MAG: amylo-alpha-1,6-glucosidase [Candidatus Sumerlaeia bacterium]